MSIVFKNDFSQKNWRLSIHMKLSVILITKNESNNILECLDSVKFADEWIIVDSGSIDDTVAKARSFGAKVTETDWPGFGPQKNRALDAATGDWILSIDADERITPELADEIMNVIHSPDPADAYEILRKGWYCGKFMNHGDWSKDYVVRLFKRGSARFTEDKVHERLVVSGKIRKLGSTMLHYSFMNFSQVIQTMDRYSELSAEQKFQQGKKAGVGTALGHGLWAFIRCYLIKGGFLDGGHGLALAISNAEGSYYRYLKIWQMHQAEKDRQNSKQTGQ